MNQAHQEPSGTKTSPWIWVAVGCGGLTVLTVLVVVGVVGFGLFQARGFLGDLKEDPVRAVAQLAIDRHPDLEVVDSDDEAGTFTVRNLQTGEVATLNFQDIADGKFTVTTEEGDVTVSAAPSAEGGGITISGPEGEARMGASASLEDVPEWVPFLPDATESSGAFQMTTSEGIAGMVAQKTDRNTREVLDWFKDWFGRNGYEISGETVTTSPGGSYGALTGSLAEEGRTIGVTVIESEDGTQVAINYTAENDTGGQPSTSPQNTSR